MPGQKKYSRMKTTEIFLTLILFLTFFSCQSPTTLPEVKEIDLSQIDPSLFSEEEWFVPYYLEHFATVANSVVDTGEHRGFFSLSVWRGAHNHHTYNARVMEGILSLVWFYCTDRPWNVYHGDPALKKRIEASLQFWSKMQHPDGRFSEYAVDRWGLAPTAFATKFIGRALWLLDKQGPQIDADIFEQSRVSLRKAIYIGFTDDGLWEHGKRYSNQYANLWGGALSYLDVWPDDEIEQLLHKRLKESLTALQSPLGFFYEKGGPDWGYNLSTHHSDLQVAWEYADEEIRDIIIEKTRRWYHWFSYNALKEPGNMCYYLNRAIETRQRKAYYAVNELEDPAHQRWVPQAEFVTVAQAFEMAEQAYNASVKKHYNEMIKNYPDVDPLEPGEFDAFTPYAFLHHNMKQWHPTIEQQEEAIQQLPYFKDSSFIKTMHDERSKTNYTFVRTPDYYATFNSGDIIEAQQRYGLGLIWTPQLGTIFQSHSRTDEATWGTKAGDAIQVYEASDLWPEKMMNDSEANQPFRSSVIKYKLAGNGEKTIVFHENKINVEVDHPGSFKEILPLLISEDDLISVNDGQVHIQTPNGSFEIHSSEKNTIEIKDHQEDLGKKRCKVIEIDASDRLTYEFVF